VFLYPFKLFVSIEPDIRRKLAKLQEEAAEEIEKQKKEAATRAATEKEEADAKQNEQAKEEVAPDKKDTGGKGASDADKSDNLPDTATDSHTNERTEGECKLCGQLIPTESRRK
jgi:hypothetical protein